jgi:hypothetical protein
MSLKIKKLNKFKNQEELWNSLIDQSKYNWYYSTREFFNFNLQYLKERNIFLNDYSFVVLENNIPCAIVILLTRKSDALNKTVGFYSNDDLPWPIISDDVTDKEVLYNFIFDEIDKSAKKNGISKISFKYNLNQNSKREKNNFIKTVKKFSYIDKSYLSHLAIINENKNIIRKSYLKNIKKNIDNYNISIMNYENFDKTFYKRYMDLHIQDSGKKYRSGKTYKMQFDLVKKNKGFVIQVFSKNNYLLGALVIYHDSISAYDASVAVQNSDKEHYISHIMKFIAMRHLNEINISEYELGLASILPTINNIPSKKNYGISFFKEGWTNGIYKKVMVTEKYYDKLFLKKELTIQLNTLINHYSL